MLIAERVGRADRSGRLNEQSLTILQRLLLDFEGNEPLGYRYGISREETGIDESLLTGSAGTGLALLTMVSKGAALSWYEMLLLR